jgi:hypothetical protein
VRITRVATVAALGLGLATPACSSSPHAQPTAAPGARPAAAGFPPPSNADPADAPNNPLDLRRVTLGQRGTRLELELRTAGAWSARDLAPGALCVELRRRRAGGRVCVAVRDGALVLEYARAARAEQLRVVPAVIRRTDRRSLSARFSARAVGLPHGTFRWTATSRWQRVRDRVPDHGAFAATVSPLADVPCFGAAARAPGPACTNPRLRTAVTPHPSNAVWSPGAPCRPVRDPLRSDVLRPCEFGDRHTNPQPALALIGDSHADHWRAAVDVVAQARGWRAVNLTRAGCSFSTQTYPAPAPIPADCRRHSEQALRWLRAHPSVHTVVISNSAGRGLGAAGYRALWQRVPPSVRRIHVLRDIPRMRVSTGDCVTAARRRHEPAARACAVPRRWALVEDTSAQAAAAARGRVRLIDLTRFFCDRTHCFPVVGGAYVHKDPNHMNKTFARTLGPFLLERMR